MIFSIFIRLFSYSIAICLLGLGLLLINAYGTAGLGNAIFPLLASAMTFQAFYISHCHYVKVYPSTSLSTLSTAKNITVVFAIFVFTVAILTAYFGYFFADVVQLPNG